MGQSGQGTDERQETAGESLLPAGPLDGEKLLQNLPALLLQHSAEHGATVIQPRVVRDGVERMARPPLRIGRSVDDAGDPGLDDCPRTHRAGFQGGVKSAVGQPPGSELLGGLGDREDFRMGGRIVQRLALIESFADDPSFVDDDRTDGDFLLLHGGLRLLEGTAHPSGVW